MIYFFDRKEFIFHHKTFLPHNFNMKHICKYSTYIVYLMIIFKNRYNSFYHVCLEERMDISYLIPLVFVRKT